LLLTHYVFSRLCMRTLGAFSFAQQSCAHVRCNTQGRTHVDLHCCLVV
jgi:hypothetical protein